uniref:Uncharacterized protein n=1 Tax=Avena sativa TaxID=4498 RepID=A0ACD5ZR92_AVESA
MRTAQVLLLGLALVMLTSAIEADHCGPEIGTGPLPCDINKCTSWCWRNGGWRATCVPEGCRCDACWKDPPNLQIQPRRLG